jgi:hypothetical protein
MAFFTDTRMGEIKICIVWSLVFPTDYDLAGFTIKYNLVTEFFVSDYAKIQLFLATIHGDHEIRWRPQILKGLWAGRQTIPQPLLFGNVSVLCYKHKKYI